MLKESRMLPNRSTISRSLDLKRVKMAISEHNDKTLKQIPSSKQTKKVLCKPKTDPLERKMQEDKQIISETIRPKSWPNRIEVRLKILKIFKIIIFYRNYIYELYVEKIFVKIIYQNN